MDMRIPALISARMARLSLFKNVLQGDGDTVSPVSREMSRWFADLPADNPLTVIDSLGQRVLEISTSTGSANRKFRQLEQIIGYAEPMLKRLEQQLDQCRLPIDSASKQAANSADQLLKSLSEGYMHIVQALDKSNWQRRLNSKVFATSLLRSAQLIHRRAMVAHRAHTPGSPRRWKLFRKLLSMAQKHQLIDYSIDTRNPETLEQVVVRDCLMNLVDPVSLESAELGRIRFYVERFGHLAQLTTEQPAEHAKALFVFSEAPRGPTQLAPDQTLQEKEYLLDCRPLIERATQQLSGLRQGLHATKLGLPMVANEASYAFMLSRCMEQWSDAKSRRHIRRDYQPLAELVSGFDPIRNFLTSAAFRRRKSDKQEGVGKGLSVASEWRILDQSRSGFGLRQASEHTRHISVGEVVAMRPLERSNVHICIVRRARNVEDKDCELGLERLGGTGMPTSIDKTLPDGHTHAIPVLLLPRVQCFDGGPGLLAPVGDVNKGMSLLVAQQDGNVRFEVTGSFERLASCELIQLRRV
ncbi:hypothetical protein VVD49_14725 [Uliginosibacterium sp. H3]|uniref:PilZ domain-containing protein n=1 Tax=Uliginosibacterium silvisoli TaxID=3114758 RepID=A0ABU6K5W6_9RHOO|nr:hypothetical protein [Uliginosibacterium sp. H3]